MFIPGPSINIYGTNRFVARKQLFDESRIKRKPPKSTTADESKPGLLCWGQVGDLPSAEAVPEVSFEVHEEKSRETTPIRIENPDDPSQYVDALQTNKMKLEKTNQAEKNNSSTKDSSVDEYGFATLEQNSFKKSDGTTAPTQYTVTYKPPERAL